MNVEIRIEAAKFHEKEYKNGTFFAVQGGLNGRVPGVTRGYHGVLEVTLGYRGLPGGTRRITEVYHGEPGFTTGQVSPWWAPKVKQGGNAGCHGVPRVTRS
jgi:hypothetical protein